jgi:surface polysaccharide O-acyltransferase-like enzyme
MALKQLWGKTVQFILQKPIDVLLIFLFAIVIIKLYSLYFSVNVDDGNWEQFKSVHSCKMLTTETGTQRLSWECDDHEIYYRWRQQR